MVLSSSKGRKKRDQKTNQKSATLKHRRVSAHSPPKTALSTPSNARIERRNVPEYIGARFDAEHPSRAGREEDLSSGVCVFEKQKSKEICKVSFIEEASIAQKPTSLDDGAKR